MSKVLIQILIILFLAYHCQGQRYNLVFEQFLWLDAQNDTIANVPLSFDTCHKSINLEKEKSEVICICSHYSNEYNYLELETNQRIYHVNKKNEYFHLQLGKQLIHELKDTISAKADFYKEHDATILQKDKNYIVLYKPLLKYFLIYKNEFSRNEISKKLIIKNITKLKSRYMKRMLLLNGC